jgi:hypothetical protein
LILIQSESIIHGYVIFYSFSIAANVKWLILSLGEANERSICLKWYSECTPMRLSLTSFSEFSVIHWNLWRLYYLSECRSLLNGIDDVEWMYHVVARLFTLCFFFYFRYMINFAEDTNDFLWHGILLVCVKFSSDIGQVLMANYFNNICHIIGIKIRTSVSGALYRKVRHKHYSQGNITWQNVFFLILKT